VDSHGNLVVAVSGFGNNPGTWARVEVVAATTGRFYGQAMTARHIYPVAGDGTAGSAATVARPATPTSTSRPASQPAVRGCWSPATGGSG